MSRYRGSVSSTLYIRNISDRVRYDDVRRLFSKYGKIVDVTIPLDYYSGMPKGYCFIEFEDPRDAEEAQYKMDRQRVFGREIDIEFARGDRKTPGEMRNRDRDRRYTGRSGRMDEYDRNDRHRSRTRSRSRSRSRSGDRRANNNDRDRERDRERGSRVTRNRDHNSSYSRSRSRSYSKHRSPSSPRSRNHNNTKSVSRERSISRNRSLSRNRDSSPRRNEMRSPNAEQSE